VNKRRAGFSVALVACAAAEAAEPVPAQPAAAAASVAVVPKTQSAKPLDLRIGDVRNYMMPNEYREALGAPDADKNTVVVEGNRAVVPWKSDSSIPGGIMAPFWALAHPLQGWRIFAPDLKAPEAGPPDPVPPRIFRWGP